MSYTFNKNQARELINMADSCDRELKALCSVAAASEQKTVRLADEYFKARVDAELATMPPEELSKAKLGIRIAPIREAGFDNLAQLRQEGWIKLSRLEGIGETSAQRISYAVNKMAENIEETIKIRLSPDDPTDLSNSLVSYLHEVMVLRSVEVEAGKLYNETHDVLATNAKTARSAAGGLISLFSRSSSADAERALNNLSAVLTNGYIDKIKAFSKRTQLARNVDLENCWKDFTLHSADYYALLEALTTESKKSSLGRKFKKAAEFAMQKGLPEELAVEIENVELNLIGLKCTLRPYQLFGVQYILNQGAVLLGDEMGLGKTIQAIASMVCLRNSGETHFMVVCPAGVLVNWCREIEKHSDLVPVQIHGFGYVDRLRLWERDGGVAVTTYETISKFTLSEGFTYGMLIADEAHYAKNPEAIRSRALMILRRKTGRALFMTGTALENNVEEMGSLINCLQPDIAKDIRNSTSLTRASDFRQKVAPVYFRRTRDDVLDELPEKIENTVWCTMGPEEKLVYNLTVYARQFMAMRQVSWNVKDVTKSVKAQELKSICEEAVENGKKVIVFSFFINTLTKAAQVLECPCFGPINGSVSPDNRQKIIDDFTNYQGGAVLVSQIQAGGTGLNIQAASVIVFCEPQIKPSLETQAISRAYRMGQVNTVLVYRILCENTVDEHIMNILTEKQALFDSFAEQSVSGLESLKLGQAEYDSIMDKELSRLRSEDPQGQDARPQLQEDSSDCSI